MQYRPIETGRVLQEIRGGVVIRDGEPSCVRELSELPSSELSAVGANDEGDKEGDLGMMAEGCCSVGVSGTNVEDSSVGTPGIIGLSTMGAMMGVETVLIVGFVVVSVWVLG